MGQQTKKLFLRIMVVVVFGPSLKKARRALKLFWVTFGANLESVQQIGGELLFCNL